MEPNAVAERLFPGRVGGVEPLGGGITNRNYKVDLGDEQVVLRIGGKETALLGIDREVEHVASRTAATLGLAPDVVCFVEPDAILVTRFIDGTPLPPERARRPDTLRRIGTMLRSLHDGPSIPGRFDSFRVVEAYRAAARTHGVSPPATYADAKAVADRIEVERGAQPVSPCHNDLLAANFIVAAEGDRIWIVDWEYAGMGDAFFDLANFAANHELDESGEDELLRAYFGEVRDADRSALRLMRFMSDFREAMWGVVQQAISELDFDFTTYAREHFERMERTASDASFRTALGA